MDTISTAFTAAWLDAVHRAQSASYQHFVQQVPQSKPPVIDRTLTDVIESGIEHGGARPPQQVNGVVNPADNQPTTHRVDRLA
jgi:hypothetical protein